MQGYKWLIPGLMLMLATAVEGRLIGVNPYGQPGVEAYKKHMTEYLRR